MTGEKLRGLTAMRGVAALLVFGRHVPALAGGGGLLLPQGAVGVSFFFILSGFVLAWSRSADAGARVFYRRRAARVLPAYYAVWALVAGLAIARGEGLQLSDVPSLFLVQSWVPSERVYYGVLGVFWSLSTEVAFYLAFPVLFAVLARLTSSRRRLAMVACVAAVFVVAIGAPNASGDTFAFWLVYIAPPVRLAEFALGVLLALELRSLPNLPFVPVVGLAGAAVLLAGHVPFGFLWVATTIVPFALVIVATAQRDLRRSAVPSGLDTFGVWSYGFYLVHTVVILELLRVLDSPRQIVAVALVLGVAGAALLHTLVERPLEARLRPTRRPAELAP